MADWFNQQLLADVSLDMLGKATALAIILALTLIAVAFVRRLGARSVKVAVERVRTRGEGDVEEIAKRYSTLGGVAIKVGLALIWTVAGFMALSKLGLDIAPILASAGIVGIAVGFGAQTLVKDLIAGAFIILENQFGKGDVVKVAGNTGLVEEVGLRRTVLRDLDGTVHHVPNGEIRVASNLTREWSRVNFNVNVPYQEDLDSAMALIDRVGRELAADPEFGLLVVEAPKALRVEAFEDSGVAIKILGVTKPMKQWEVMGEMRRRLKRAFDEEGIEIPFPHRVMLVRGEKERPRAEPSPQASFPLDTSQ